jgi:hypothetical protein
MGLHFLLILRTSLVEQIKEQNKILQPYQILNEPMRKGKGICGTELKGNPPHSKSW